MKSLKQHIVREHSPPYNTLYYSLLKINKSIMKHFFLYLLFANSILTVKCQLTKGNWLVGGTGKFSIYNNSYISSNYNVEYKYTDISISPSVGYFVSKKLAFGLRPTFSSSIGKSNLGSSTTTTGQRYLIGPFGRYYFLNQENPFNILADLSYQFGIKDIGGPKGNLSNFSALVGPVIYLNSSVGIEFLLGYSKSKEEIEGANKDIESGFQIALGFQIHLEK